MANCCGEKRETPFCPLCGKKVKGAGGLAGLLVYLRSHESKNQVWLNRIESGNGLGKERRAKQAAQVRDKWKGWADALERLMRGDAGGEEVPRS